MNNQTISDVLNALLLIVLALTNYLMVEHRKSLSQRIDDLERLLDDFRKSIEAQTPKN